MLYWLTGREEGTRGGEGVARQDSSQKFKYPVYHSSYFMMNTDDNTGQGGSSNPFSDFINDHFSDADQGYYCKYFEIDEFAEKVKDCESNYFSTLSLNVRSLSNKLNEFREFIEEINSDNFAFDIIGLQELWNIPELLNTDIPGYSSLVGKIRVVKDKNNVGGGIGFYVKKDVEFEVLHNLSFFEAKAFESLFIKVKTGRKTFKIVDHPVPILNIFWIRLKKF